MEQLGAGKKQWLCYESEYSSRFSEILKKNIYIELLK